MKISGKCFREHLELLAPLFGIIAAVWFLRGLLGFFPAPSFLATVISLSLVVPACIVLATLLIHSRSFGGYANVVFSAFLLVTWAQLLIVAAILASVLFGLETIYSAPEFSVPDDPQHIRHIRGHLTFGIGLESLIGSAMGCVLLAMLRTTRKRFGRQ